MGLVFLMIALLLLGIIAAFLGLPILGMILLAL